MFDSWGASWQLVKASWAVLSSDKELLWYPILSGLTMIAICIVMFVPSVMWAFSSAMFEGSRGEETMNILGYVLLFIFYLITYTANIYFNVALVGAAMIRLDGGDPKLSDGFRTANERFGKIVGYGVISATVGVILQFIRDSDNFIAKIVSDLIGMAWNLATFFVIPILVVKNLGPIDAVKESAGLLKRTWGEQVTGGFSIGGIFFLIYLVVIILGIILIGFAASTENGFVLVTAVILVIFAFLATAIINGALSGIFQATLYRYAETGVAPDNFDIDMIQGAFKEKKKKN
jgi:hypothetical protein